MSEKPTAARVRELTREIARVEAERDAADLALVQLRIAVQRYAATGRDDTAFQAMLTLAKESGG